MDVHPPAPSPADGDADGPPPPPFVRERARRRRLVIIAVVVGLLALAVPVGLAAALLVPWDRASDVADPAFPTEEDTGPDVAPDGDTEPDDGEPGSADGESGSADGDEAGDPPASAGERPDRRVPQEERIEPPALDGLDADDRAAAQLLLDVEAAERSMLSFQLAVQEAFLGESDATDPTDVLGQLRSAARAGLSDLATLRDRLVGSDHAGPAERVRDTYVEHLDAWVDYLEAVVDDPQVMLDETTTHTIEINRTGDAFSRAVDALVATDLDADVARFAEQIVERGFRGTATPQV